MFQDHQPTRPGPEAAILLWHYGAGSPQAGVTDHAATWHAPAAATTSEDAYEITNCGCLASRLSGGVAVARPATGGGAAGEGLGTSPVAWTARYTMRA
jgi:hypothetical protein